MRKKYVYYLHNNFVSLDLFSVHEENRYGRANTEKKMSNMFFEGRVGYFVANFEIELANLFNCFVKGREDV